jgi:multiple antibiotic resistance protein
MKTFWMCFVPLFLAVDAIGVLPLFINLTKDVKPKKINPIIYKSVITATIVALLFLAFGLATFKLMGITIADFMVAGGILLFGLAFFDLFNAKKKQQQYLDENFGVVPFGVPLITGPAVLTTSVILVNQFGIFFTALALVANTGLAGFIFYFSPKINKFLGNSGTQIISKIANLLLASIGIMMVRKGITIIVMNMSFFVS